jgi:hypothetical protein
MSTTDGFNHYSKYVAFYPNDEVRFSKTTVKIYHTTRRHMSDNRNRVTRYLKPGQPEHHAVVLHF